MQQSTLYELQRGSLLTLSGLRGRTLRVESGSLWLTEHAQPQDAMLDAAHPYQVQGTHTVVIEALAPTRLLVPHDCAVSDMQEALRALLQALTHTARAMLGFVRRAQLGRA
jgi:hypothetical protein